MNRRASGHPRHDLADEVVAPAVDASRSRRRTSPPAPRRTSGARDRSAATSCAATRSVVSITPTSRSQCRASRRWKITCSRSSNARYEVVHERLFVDAVLVERPCRLRPSRASDRVRAVRRDRGRTTPAPTSATADCGVPVHRRDVELQLGAGGDQVELRHPVEAQQEVDVEVERDPLAPLVLGQLDRAARRCRRSPTCPRCSSGRRSADGRPRAPRARRFWSCRRRSACGALARASRSCWPTIGLGGPTRSVCADVAVEDEALQDAAELGVAFLVAAQVGARSSKTCPSCRGCRAAAGRTSISPCGISSGGKVTGTVSTLRSHAGRAPR